MNHAQRAPHSELPIALGKWYDHTKWVLDRVDGLPKNQRFVLGTRLADAVLEVMELLAEAAYARGPWQGGTAGAREPPDRIRALAGANLQRPQSAERRAIRLQRPLGGGVRADGGRLAAACGGGSSEGACFQVRCR